MSEGGALGFIAVAQRKNTTGTAGQITVDADGDWGGLHPGVPAF